MGIPTFGQVLGNIGGGIQSGWNTMMGEGAKQPSLVQEGIDQQEAIATEDENLIRQEGITANVDAARLKQSEFAGMLRRRAEGTAGPSAAEGQLQLATDQNMRQALAMAASGRGNPALAGQAAGRQRALMGQQSAQQASSLRAQEQQAASTQLGSVLQGARQAEAAEAQRQFGFDQLASNERQAQMQADAARDSAKAAAKGQQQSGMMGAAGSILSALVMSDEDEKMNKENVPDAEIDEFYKALQSKSFEYKDPQAAGASSGEKVGLMAQDVDQTKLGQKLFSDGPDGKKQYDPQVLDGILLAGMKKLMKDQNYGND